MEWRDQGMVLAVRRYGESAAIVEVFTECHGRHAGVVQGGGGRRMAPILQPGAQLDLTWRARLDAHIGTFSVEPLQLRAAGLMGDQLALSGLNAICALLVFALPERVPQPELYTVTLRLIDQIVSGHDWVEAYLRWELALLEDMGFGLDLGICAVTGARDDLAFVSPRSGRAVSRAGAGQWADRLLPLPSFLLGQGPATGPERAQALALTGYFLKDRLAPALGDRPLPVARQRLVDVLVRKNLA